MHLSAFKLLDKQGLPIAITLRRVFCTVLRRKQKQKKTLQLLRNTIINHIDRSLETGRLLSVTLTIVTN